MARRVITDETWRELKPLLPAPKGRHGRDDRTFIEGVCWLLRTGAPIRDLPKEFGPWQTIYNRFNRWVKKRHFERIFEVLKKRWVPRISYD